jgi:hypothetical protein
VDVEAWQALGATHLTVNTMGVGLSTADAHIALLQRFQDMLPASG